MGVGGEETKILKNPINLNYQNLLFITPKRCKVLINTILKRTLHHVSAQLYHLQGEKMPVFKTQLPLESCYL